MPNRQPSRLLIAGIAAAAGLVLAYIGIQTDSLRAVLAVGAAFALIAVIPFVAVWLRPSKGGPETLTSQNEIRLRLEQLRDGGASEVSAIWSGRYDPAEVDRYFRDEKRSLETNEDLHISRVINPAVIPDEHFDLLQAIREQYKTRFMLYEDSTLRSFELYVADYPSESGKDAVAVVVINNTLNDRPEVAMVLDPADDKGLAGAVDAVRKWWESIREGLPIFDPVAIERWDHIATRYTKLVTENANKIEFLDDFSRRESEMVADHLRSIADDGNQLTVVEVGCADGRALFSYIPPEIAASTSYIFGLDYAPAMIESAENELSRLKRMTTRVRRDARVLNEKTSFFQLNAAHMRRFFDDGRLHELEQLVATSSSADGIDHSTYMTSRKVFCCLLNTLGVIEPSERRTSVLESILACLGVEDTLLFTAFAAERFASEAKSLYHDLEEMIDTQVTDTQFDPGTATFSVMGTPGYYSHWFTERELRQLVNDATEGLEREGRSFDRLCIEPMGTGGYFASIRRSG